MKNLIDDNRALNEMVGDCSGDMARLSLRLAVTTARLETALAYIVNPQYKLFTPEMVVKTLLDPDLFA